MNIAGEAQAVAELASYEPINAMRHIGMTADEFSGEVSGNVKADIPLSKAAQGEKLDWRKSIVDLMKLLNLDSSLNARKELAKELGYTGSTSDSATMNIWLHKQVMQKLAANGGKVPADLMH